MVNWNALQISRSTRYQVRVRFMNKGLNLLNRVVLNLADGVDMSKLEGYMGERGFSNCFASCFGHFQ